MNSVSNFFKENRILRNYGGVLVALLALIVLFSVLSPYFLNTRNLLQVLSQVSIIAVMAFGMTFVLMIGEIDLSVGSIAAISSLILGMGLTAGLPAIIAILLALLAGAFCGLINGSLGARLKIPSFIVTVATMGIFRGIGYSLTDSKPVPIGNDMIIALGNGKFLNIIPYPVILMMVLLVIFQVLLVKTRFGRRAKMVGGNKTAAEYVGIDSKKLQVKIFIISGISAAISGILLASRLYSAQPNVATGYELDAIAAAVLGGTSLSGGYGTVVGTIIGAVIMGIINNGMNLIGLPYFYQQIVKGIIIILAVYMDVRNKERILGSKGE